MESSTHRCALLVMDFENDIVSMTAAGGSGKAVQRVRVAIDGARQIGIPVIFIRVGYRIGYPEVSTRNKRVTMLKEKRLLSESETGAQLITQLAVRPDDPIVVKRRVSALAHTDLQPLLNSFDVDTLVLAGLATSGVVLSTVRQAADADYRLIVLKDACADIDQEIHDMLMKNIFPQQAEVMTVEEFLHSVK